MEIFAVIDFPGYRCARVFPLSSDQGGHRRKGGWPRKTKWIEKEIGEGGAREKRKKSRIQYIFSVNNRRGRGGGGGGGDGWIPFCYSIFFNYGYSERKRKVMDPTRDETRG